MSFIVTLYCVASGCGVGLGGGELCWYNFEHNGRQINVSITEHNGGVSDN